MRTTDTLANELACTAIRNNIQLDQVHADLVEGKFEDAFIERVSYYFMEVIDAMEELTEMHVTVH